MVIATDRLIDFEGDYGADYDHQIRLVIAGYGLMHELGVDAARASCPCAKELLIVGPVAMATHSWMPCCWPTGGSGCGCRASTTP